MSTVGAIAKRVGTLSAKNSFKDVVQTTLTVGLGRTNYQEINLNEQYPTPSFDPPPLDAVETNISTLPNGMRVVSRSTNDPIANVGLFVQAGSRYCTPETSGVGHFLESAAVEGSNYIEPNRWAENFARTGSGLMVQAFRDAMLYQVETFNRNADFALASIGELIWNPKLEPYRIEKMKQEYLWRRGDFMKEPEHEIPEFMHQAAYQGNTLGLPLFNDAYTIKNIDRSVIDEFTRVFYQPSRMVCVGVGGITHSKLESMAMEAFGDLKGDDAFKNLNTEQAKYTGGPMKIKTEFESGINTPADTHVALIFETESWKSDDLMALCVLNMMMGGGGSFSAGGPGKGMYTRLYRQVLGQYHWINHISCSHSIFDDSGIFALYGCCGAESASELTSVMTKEAINMVQNKPQAQELERAKKALASNICFEFENRQIVFEDIARQVSVYGTHKTPDMWREQIMAVQADDVVRVASKLLKTNPTLLAMGADVTRVPSQEEVKTVIAAEI